MKITDNKIGEGRYRECFATDDPDLCAKTLKQDIEKKCLGLLNATFNTKKYASLKFKIEDLNEMELEIIQGLPEELSSYIPSHTEIKDDSLVMQRPRDFDGEYSQTVQEHGKIENDSFWEHIDEIITIFEQNNLWFLDIFHSGNNLLVQKISDTHYKPVIIDFKRLGRQMYPFQLNLILESELKRKFYRRLRKFKKNFKDKSREGFTAEKGLHFVRVLFSRKATEILDAYQKFGDIDFEKLSILGKHGIILDIDECVAPHHGDILPENLAKIRELLEGGWKIVIFSNMKKSGRYRELEGLGVQVITSKYAKPDARGFGECVEKLGLSRKEVVMIGDNYLTDGGCKNAEIDFIKIKPIVTEDESSGIRRKLQIKFRSLIDSRAENVHKTLNYK